MRSKNRNQKVSKTRVNMRKNKSISGKLKQRRKTKTMRNRRRKIVGGNLDEYYNKLVSEFNSHSGNWTFKNLLDNVFGKDKYVLKSSSGRYGLTNNIKNITKQPSQINILEIEVIYDELTGKGLVDKRGPEYVTYQIWFDNTGPNHIDYKDSSGIYTTIYEKKN